MLWATTLRPQPGRDRKVVLAEGDQRKLRGRRLELALDRARRWRSDRQPSSIAPTEAPGCVDDLHLPGMLHGVVVRSCSAHALLEGVDYDPAFDWSSVVRVDAGAIPGVNRLAPFPPDQPVLAQGICRHVGEPVLLLAAGSRARALQARHRLRLRERPLPAQRPAGRAGAGVAAAHARAGRGTRICGRGCPAHTEVIDASLRERVATREERFEKQTPEGQGCATRALSLRVTPPHPATTPRPAVGRG
jgi:hypothetical protein